MAGYAQTRMVNFFHNAPQGHADCFLLPEWPAPERVKAVCTTRAGGWSDAPYDSFNLGVHVGDDPQKVQYNRQRLKEMLGVHPVFLEQVHGTHILELNTHTPDQLQADASTTTHPGVACTVMVADCLPILLCDTTGRRVAAIHAGWRGLLGVAGVGVVERFYAHFLSLDMEKHRHTAPKIIAWLGPCIGPHTFEVGPEVYRAFTALDVRAQGYFVARASAGTYLADLAGLARLRLQAMGVHAIYGNDGSAAWCTVSKPERFFSYRRDGVTGRQAACIWLDSD